MKHIFVINPVAGKKNVTEKITNELKDLIQREEYKDLEYEIYNTTEVGDGARFTRERCEQNNGQEHLRFYACGGDGTINGVVNGLMNQENVSFSCYPCGSGNDFVKAFPNSDFTNIENLINGEEKQIDYITVNGKACINMVNNGFDAAVAYHMCRFKHWPLVSGKMAYKLGLVKALFKDMKHYADIYAENEKIDLEGFLLSCACNGEWCGGSFHCSPRSVVDDGFMDVVAIQHMSVFKFLKLVKYYQTGTYLENEEVMKNVRVYKIKHLKIVSKKGEIIYGLDGESYKSDNINIDLVEKGVTIAIPIKK